MSLFYNDLAPEGITFAPIEIEIEMRTTSDINILLTTSAELLTRVVASSVAIQPEGVNNQGIIGFSTRYYVAVSLLLSDGRPDNQARYRAEALESLIGIGKALKTDRLNPNSKLERLWRSSEPLLRILKEKVLCC